MAIPRETEPLIVLNRIPTANELEQIRHYIKCYMAEHPNARKWEIRNAAQNEFNQKIISKPFKRENNARVKAFETLNTKPVKEALTRRMKNRILFSDVNKIRLFRKGSVRQKLPRHVLTTAFSFFKAVEREPGQCP